MGSRSTNGCIVDDREWHWAFQNVDLMDIAFELDLNTGHEGFAGSSCNQCAMGFSKQRGCIGMFGWPDLT